MALASDLIQFLNKPSGVYRILEDFSEVNVAAASSVIPLVIGYSSTGIFNTPVACSDRDFFINVFGNKKTSEERKGSWFHRTCLELLTTGPIIALNLYNLKNEAPNDLNATELTDQAYDLTEYKALSTGYTYTNQTKQNQVLTRLFNTSKFWFPDSEKLNDFASLTQTDALISFFNFSQKPVTVLTRKSTISGFDVTLSEWYGAEDVPEFLNANDYVSDFFIDVIVLSGDYTDYTTLSTDPIFGNYFNENGLIVEQLQAFLALKQVNILSLYSGCLIPDFVDKQNQVLDIKTLVNQDNLRTGLIMGVNVDYLYDNIVTAEQYDLVGHKAYAKLQEFLQGNDTDAIEYLSYKGEIVTESSTNGLDPTNMAAYFDVSGVSGEDITLTIPSTTPSSGFAALYSKVQANEVNRGAYITLDVIDGVPNSATIKFEVASSEIVGTDAIITFSPVDWASEGIVFATVTVETTPPIYSIPSLVAAELNTYFAISGVSGEVVTVTIPATGATTPFQNLYAKGVSNEISVGDKLTVDLVDGIPTTVAGVELIVNDVAFGNSDELIITFDAPDYGALGLVFGTTQIDTSSGPYTFEGLSYTFYHNVVPYVEFDINTAQSAGLPANEVMLDNIDYGPSASRNIQVGGYILSEYSSGDVTSRLTRIKQVITVGNYYKIVAEGPIYQTNDSRIWYTENINETFETYNLTSLFGYRIKDRLKPNDTNERVNEIYGVLNTTNIGTALQDKRLVTFRYLVDTFNHGIEPNSKSVLTSICFGRENAFAILNAPSIKNFEDSADPLFTDLPTAANPVPDFDTKYIPQGGNRANNPTSLYSLPTVEQGAAFGAFYSPNILVRERGRTLKVPPAMFVAKNFVTKHTNFKPWSIIAGERRGIISGLNVTGVEYNYDDIDSGYLENWGINPIVAEEGVGLKITGNSTAQQTIKTALSQINGTEVTIYLGDRIASVIKKYVWEFNTSVNRLQIKTIADQEFEQVRVDGGIRDYVNQMDEFNNDNDVIDNLLGVLTSSFEISKGMKSIVNRLRIFGTGQIASGLAQ